MHNVKGRKSAWKSKLYLIDCVYYFYTHGIYNYNENLVSISYDH